MSTILAVLGWVAAGAVGWFTLQFIGRPVRNFFDLRQSTRTQLVRLEGGVMLPLTDERAIEKEGDETLIALRNLSAELISFGHSERLAVKFLRCIGFEPLIAGQHLENLLLRPGEQSNYRAVLKALKLPVPGRTRRPDGD